MRSAFLKCLLFFFVSCFIAGNANANDSDVVNCNRVWKIAILGSSTSFGQGASTYDSSWAGKFTAYLKRKNIQSDIYNLGVPGFTTYQNLRPTGYIPPAGRPTPNSEYNITTALALHPDALIINMPSNDANNNYSVAEQQANYQYAAYLADSANVPLWVTTTQPRNNLTVAQVSNLTTMRDWIISRFGSKSVDFWTTIANGDGSIVPFYAYDYAHVTNAGHDIFYRRMKAETILDSLCIRAVPTLVARAGDDINIVLPANAASLNGSASFSSMGGVITSYQWSYISGPAGSMISNPSSAVTNVSNLMEGRYAFRLTVTDNSSGVKSDTVAVVVSSRLLIDFGPDAPTAPDVYGRYWNNVPETQNGIKFTNGITIANLATNIGFEVLSRIDGTFNTSGPGTNNGNTAGAVIDYPASATNDFSFAHPSATNGQWKLSGLDATKQYTVKFWGTRSVADDRLIQIKRADQTIWQEYNAANNLNYNHAAIFSFSGKTQMTFDIRVKAESAFGHISVIDIARTTPAVSLNIPPIARANDVNVAIPNTSCLLDATSSSDDDGTIVSYSWSQTSGPSTSQIVSPASATTTVNNLVEGIYVYLLSVRDDSSAIATQMVTVTVNSRILFDIGPDLSTSPDAGGKYWNNVVNGLPGVKISNAVTTGNTATTLNLEIINRIDGTFNPTGPGTNTGNTIGAVGDYPVSATADFAFAHLSTTTGKWKLSGLKPAKQYNIKFWGTRTASDERIIRIKRSDETTYQAFNATMNTDYNNAASFVFTGKSQMEFDISVDANSSFGHISVVDIKITNPPVLCAPTVSVTSNRTGQICLGTPVTFTAAVTNGGTAPVYQWRKNGLNLNVASSPTYTSTTLQNNDAISCFVTANTNCTGNTTASSNSISFSVLQIASAAGPISGPVNVCAYIGSATNAVYSVNAVANASTYTWVVPNGATIISGQGSTTITVSFTSSLSVTDTIRVSAGPCTNSASSRLVIQKAAPLTPNAISGPTNACPFVGTGNVTYSIVAVADATSYTWTVPSGATLSSGQGTTSIQVSYSTSFVSGLITVTANAACGNRPPRSLSISRSIPAMPTAITGPQSACPYLGNGIQAVYSIPAVAFATSYLWTLPANMTMISGQGTTSLTVTFTSDYITSDLKVRAIANCGSSADRSLRISTTTSTTPGTITGPTNACPFIGTSTVATYSIRKVANAGLYVWTVPAGMSITSHPGGSGANDTIITVAFNASFVSGTSLGVRTGGCVLSAQKSLVISRSAAPPAPGSITGVTNVCVITGTGTATAYSISKISVAVSYNWTIPVGATATHPNGAGINDTVVLVSFRSGYTTGIISVAAVNACGSSANRSLTVKAISPTSTPSITGPTDVCPWVGPNGASYTIRKIANATSYTWTIPATGASVSHPNGAGINDTIIIITFSPAFSSGTITARADAACGSGGTRALTVASKLPARPSAITGTALAACPNRRYTYSIAAMPASATSVTWAVPSGATIINGQGTLSITVSYVSNAVSGYISTVGTNNCGSSSSSRTLAVNFPACVAGKAGESETPSLSTNISSVTESFHVTAFPNPSVNEFNVIISSPNFFSPVVLRVFDVNGKLKLTKNALNIGTRVSFGDKLVSGVYTVEITQGVHRKTLRLIKF